MAAFPRRIGVNIGFIGLGIMGNPMAENLVRNGQHQVRVFDIDRSRTDNLVALGALRADSLVDAIGDADIVMTSLPGPLQIEAVACADDGLLANLKAGVTWIELSTNNLEVAAKIKLSADAAGIQILDAPVSGGDEGARAGMKIK